MRGGSYEVRRLASGLLVEDLDIFRGDIGRDRQRGACGGEDGLPHGPVPTFVSGSAK